jgi:VWFA-related protein
MKIPRSFLWLGGFLAFLLMMSRTSVASTVLLRSTVPTTPVLAAVQTYAGKTAAIVSSVKAGEGLTVVLLLDSINTTELESVGQELSDLYGSLSGRRLRKALVVFSDGDDNASVLNANSAVMRAKRVGTPLYAIAEGEATRSKELQRLLEDLSKRTGGASYQAKKPSEIEEAFQRIAVDLRHLYMLTYRPETVSDEGRWRKIEVGLAGEKDFRIRSKEGYFPE